MEPKTGGKQVKTNNQETFVLIKWMKLLISSQLDIHKKRGNTTFLQNK